MLSALWDTIKTQSPKSEDNSMALPTPEEIGELVCKLAASEIGEKEATEIFKKAFPIGEVVARLRNSGACLVGQDQDTVPEG